MNYACYPDARLMLVATPSGVTRAPKTEAYLSIASPMIGMSQNGLAVFVPAYGDELAVFVEWATEYMHRRSDGDPDERA